MQTRRTRRNQVATLAAISILVLGGAATLVNDSLHAVRAFQEPKLRVLKRLPFATSEPLVITDVKVKGQGVLFDQNFAADDDWIKTLVISVKNRSDKRILYFSTDLFLPPVPGSKTQASVFNLSYGNHALLWDHAASAAERLVGLSPGESAELGFSGRQLENFQKFFDAVGRPNLEKVDLQFSRIIFEDDTMWDLQGPLHRDSKDPARWNGTGPANGQKNHSTKQHTRLRREGGLS
ncbi:MAG: hypothetical protein ACXW3C_09550 [Pyrinomonadaceae bacterium]